jgi:hypothetical protein
VIFGAHDDVLALILRKFFTECVCIAVSIDQTTQAETPQTFTSNLLVHALFGCNVDDIERRSEGNRSVKPPTTSLGAVYSQTLNS